MIIRSIETGNSNNIKIIEKQLNLNLPLDYKNFLLKYNGAAINNAYFFIDEIKEMIMMGIFYGVDIEDSIDIIYNNKEYEDDILENSLLIGSDPGGGWILLIFDGENDGVWYYDHSYFFEQSTDELNTYFICDSFTEFLNILEENSTPV